MTQKCFMRGTMDKLDLSKVIYVGLFTIVSLGGNKAKQRNTSLDSENRLEKRRTKSAFGLEAIFPLHIDSKFEPGLVRLRYYW